MKKILTLSSAIRKLSGRRFKSVVFFSGVFDLFHYGHFRALRNASRLGDILIVQIDGNKLVKKRKGDGRPYLDELHRAEIISSLEFVDYVFISDIPSENEDKLKSLSPDVFVRAIKEEETDDDRKNRTKNLTKKSPKTKIVWLEQTPEISTTKIISAVGRNL